MLDTLKMDRYTKRMHLFSLYEINIPVTQFEVKVLLDLSKAKT